MKKKLLNNLPLKILSLVVALFVWMAIINVIDPTMTKTITNIEIKVTDPEVITKKDQVFKIVSKNTATIIVSGKRSMVSGLEASDFTATAPLSEMSQVNAVPVYVVANKAEHRREISIIDKTISITVAIEKVEEKEYPLEIDYTGTESDGYVVDKINTGLKHSTVKIKAPQSIHNLINRVAVAVDIEDANKDFQDKYEIEMYTASKSPIPKDGIKLSFTKVQVNTTVLKTKKVPIKFSVSGKPASGFSYIGIDATVSMVQIVGKESIVDSLKEIVIPSSVLDIDERKETLVREIDINSYLPQGIGLGEQQEAKVKVTAEIQEEALHSFQLSPKTDIKLTKIPAGYAAKFADDSKVSIILRGLETLFKGFDVTTISPFVDLSKATKGDNKVTVQVSTPEGITLVKSVSLTVTLVDEGAANKENDKNKSTE